MREKRALLWGPHKKGDVGGGLLGLALIVQLQPFFLLVTALFIIALLSHPSFL